MLGVTAQVTDPNPVAVDIIVTGLNAVIAEFTLNRKVVVVCCNNNAGIGLTVRLNVLEEVPGVGVALSVTVTVTGTAVAATLADPEIKPVATLNTKPAGKPV
jgi:hypothetical protein